ncbi:disease resistance RPP13-like protein 4 [Primulina huaijiensis]|uniref:disease resistance RPP13-like protein 4 n=1 Tax=Primulina huaijiensis TaxID=1492673 RepID=UPI003CC739AE
MQTRNQEIDAIEDHLREQDVTPSENEATARHASSPNNIPAQSIATGTPEKVPNQDTATKDADFHPPVNEISPDEKVNTVKRSSSLPTGSGNDADSHPKKSSRWKTFRLLFPLFKRRKDSSPKPSGVSPTTKSETSTTSSSEDKALPNLIAADLESVDKEILALKEYNDRLIGLNKDAREEFSQKKGNHSELRKSMIKLKLLIPSQSNVDSDAFKDLQSRLKARESIPPDLLEKMPRLHKNDIFYCSPEMKDFEVLYKRLESSKLRICLLCFSIFPGNETIRKRLMTRWWVAEGLSSEEEAEQHFRKLREEGFIVPVNNNRSPFVGRYRMHTLYQSMLKILAEKAKFFNFDEKGEPTQNYKNTFQACLVGEGLLSYDDMKNGSMTVDDLEKIHLVMNVNEPILDFKPNWFSMMKNVNVLYLGRWQASDAAHIEVEETDFFDGLKNINSIKFLSLQGISNIIKLTESILTLKRLEFLDTRACHNLEEIPSRIGSLTCLTHLDISECYLLDHMPKSLSELKNLRVFKGFVVKGRNSKNSCTLADLKELKNLTKLCIYTTWNHFPDETNVRCLKGMTKLLKLTIAWGGEALKSEIGGDTSNPSEVGGETPKAKIEGGTSNPSEAGEDASKGKKASKLPSQLTKLDLKCFPLKATPSWLDIANLENLRKLYIRGGRFSDLGQYQCTDSSDTSPHKKDVWKVKVLRLKYLSNLEMEWRQLHELFPDLMYLEKISCPKLTLFNCGARGVWINPTKLKAWEKEVQLMQPQTIKPSAG